MKAIVVEGFFDHKVLDVLFPQIRERQIMVKVSLGFSNVFAVSKTLIDYGFDVLMMLDTNSNEVGHDNREVVERIVSDRIMMGRRFNIVWMDPFIEKVLDRVIPGICQMKKRHANGIDRLLYENSERILELDEFRKIAAFINGEEEHRG